LRLRFDRIGLITEFVQPIVLRQVAKPHAAFEVGFVDLKV
jgi:hypothetical protein